MYKRGQSALEYLMTYGWAILIIVLVGAALYFLGVFAPGGFTGTGRQTTGLASFKAISWSINTAGYAQIRLGNAFGEKVTVTGMSLDLEGTIGSNTTVRTFNANSDFDTIIPSLGTPSSGAPYTANIIINFTDKNGYAYRDVGVLKGNII